MLVDIDDLRACAKILATAAKDETSLTSRLRTAAELARTAYSVDQLSAVDTARGLNAVISDAGGIATTLERCRQLSQAATTAADRYADADKEAAKWPTKDHGLLGNFLLFLGELGGADLNQATQDFLAEHPDLVGLAVLFAAKGNVAATARRLGNAYPDGRAIVTELGSDTSGAAGLLPRSLTDVMSGLSQRNEGQAGEVDVRFVTSVDAAGTTTRSAIVDIPGTKDWAAPSGRLNPDVVNVGTDLRALAGDDTTYEEGVKEAMRQAGVRPDDKVMLVGHSGGGMVAVNLASHLSNSREFNVTHVVTAGAPIGIDLHRLPSRTKVLAFENHRDAVPQLDGEANVERGDVTTVAEDRIGKDLEDDHSLSAAYVPMAADADHSDDPSVRQFVDSAGGFLDGTSVETHRYLIRRG
ncbi:MAG: hypothetical protein JO147_10205 [Actinobacteria bacterium]|nr:hypothetical protein [Actinomycetota bacterium]